MTITIDASPLLVRSAGVKNYLYHWISSLRREAGRDTIRTFPSMYSLGTLNHDGSVAGAFQTWTGLGALALANHTPLPVLDWTARGSDVFHASVLVRRPPRKARLTATILDMTATTMPELHPSANQRADQSFAGLLRAADRLIAISQCTKDDAVRVLGLPPEKITVIHLGVAEPFFRVPEDIVRKVLAHYGLQKPYVLSVGTIEPRKNIGALLDAYSGLPQSIREEFDLVLAGPMGWESSELRARLSAARYLGYVPEPDLAPLTAGASVFAYPSLYEGFGFPVAQAMAAGVAVVTSNVSSLPEIAGDAALLIDPRSVAELRSALERLLTSATLRATYSTLGRIRAERYRWSICARHSLDFFRSL